MANVSVTTVTPAGTYSVNPEAIDYLLEDVAGAATGLHFREQEQVLFHAGPIATTAALFTNTGPTFVSLTAVGGLAVRVNPAAVDTVENVAALVTRIIFSSGASLDIAQAYAAVNTALGNGRSYTDLAPVTGFNETLAASQSANQLNFPVAVASYVMPRRGCLLAVTGMLSAAITGAGTTVFAEVYVDGVVVPTSQSRLDFTQAGGEVEDSIRLAPGAVEFAAGTQIDVRYTSTGISNTPTINVSLLLGLDATDTTVP